MTAQEKEILLEQLGFKRTSLFTRIKLKFFYDFKPIKYIQFQKGISPNLIKVKPTKFGYLNPNLFLVEVDGDVWLKKLNNGENTDSLRRKGRR